MKKIILMLGVVALGAISLQSCETKDTCECTDRNGNVKTIPNASEEECDAQHGLLQVTGGSCKMV
jgi:hypothetical protein